MTDIMASEGPNADLVGTVRQEVGESYTALWIKVNRAVVRRNQFTIEDEWLCIESSKVGLQGLVRIPEVVVNFPVVGYVPMSLANFRHAADEKFEGSR